MAESFTLLNTQCEHIRHMILDLYNIPTPPTPKESVMGSKPGRWFKFHRLKGHHIEDYYELKKDIERLIHDEHLKKYVKGNYSF